MRVQSKEKQIKVGSVVGYLGALKKIANSEEETLFYRGHGSVDYLLTPSIYREKKFVDNEDEMISQVMLKKPNEFLYTKGHLDILTILQHYELPTRLLDVTTNPHIALYFACQKMSNGKSVEGISEKGEVIILTEKNVNIKNFNSDTVEIVCNFAFMKPEFREWLASIKDNDDLHKKNDTDYLSEMYHSICSQRSWFEYIKALLKFEDISRAIFVMPKLDNERIVCQSGAFIACGINKELYINDANFECKSLGAIEEKRVKNREGEPLRLFVKGPKTKAKILAELKTLGITDSFVFPELNTICNEIKKSAK